MTLLITVFAAITCTIIWYVGAPKSRKLYVGILTLMYWGASIMWFVDAIYEYVEEGAAFFTPAPETIINDTFLGFSVITLALVIWMIDLLAHDPRQIVKKAILKSKPAEQ